jgi:iron(II)-dependent oxidoreductase
VSQTIVEGDLWYQVVLPDGERGWLYSSTSRLAVLWSWMVETFDDVDMVLVPPGCFPMGSAEGRGEEDEHPIHIQCFEEPFWIDRYEVSNRRYGSEGYFSGGSRPRDSVDWFSAVSYCEERGARLPTEAEWEYAARGPGASVYPWGNEFVNENVVSSWQTTVRKTDAVNSHPGGTSWVGAFNMSGNVWEWTSTLYDAYPYRSTDGREDREDSINPRVVRGGSCCSYIIADVRAAFRFPVAPFTQDPNIGFRCARSYEPPASSS